MIITELWTHSLQRCFMWRLNLIEPTSHESKVLDEADIQNPTLRSYIVWRRSQMLWSILPLSSSVVTFFIDLIRNAEDILNPKLKGWGNLLVNLSSIANIIIFISVVLATGMPYGKCRVWSNWRLSSKILRYGFIISFILPMIPAFIPLKYYVKDLTPPESNFAFSDLDLSTLLMEMEFGEGDITKQQEIVQWKYLQWKIGLSNFVKFLPALFSFPAALFGASLRIKGLLPKSTLSSWMLTVAGPFLSLVILAAAMLIIQFYGNGLLTFGVLFLAVGPWLNVFRRGLYVKAPDEETRKSIDCNQKVSLVFKLGGWILVIIWAIADYMKGDISEILEFVKLILEAWGRVLGSTVLFADVLLRMTITNWKEEMSLRSYSMDKFYQSIDAGIMNMKGVDDDVPIGPVIPGECDGH
ncbi:hypothetical protein ACHAXA_000831 [Cyclostephanos tholiformis]|uniref:Uncharacterized protein n=1 Tax=Cyclostephanos tholiformis TaxID=382380 RepID=A0ABD3RWQ0_9STRA